VASALTASHMRQCVGISPDRESIYGYQYPEPVLGFAAMRLTLTCGWQVLLDHLRDAMATTFTDGGYRGELGAQILLLMAADRAMVIASEQRFPTKEMDPVKGLLCSAEIPLVPLSLFLEILMGEKQVDGRFEGMFIRLVQFIQFFSLPGKEQVAQMFQRSCGIVVKPGARYVDLIIPVITLYQGESAESVTVAPERMSVILVQVKCWKASISLAKAAKTASTNLPRAGSTSEVPDKALNPDLDYISLLLEIGPHSGDPVYRKTFTHAELSADFGIFPDLKQTPIWISNLRPSDVLDSNSQGYGSVDQAFSKMMMARLDPLEITDVTSQAMRNLKKSIGLVYDTQ
jgi:hypothetical protein